MNLFSRKGKALNATPDALEIIREYRSSVAIPMSTYVREAFFQAQSASYAHIFKTQPAVRTVVEFMARNVSQLGIKLYERDGVNRSEDTDHPAIRLLHEPNDWTTTEQLIYDFVADFMVYDNAYLLKLRPNNGSKLILLRIPPHSMGVTGENRLKVDGYRLIFDDGRWQDLEVEDVIHWRGYNPDDPRIGVSKLETLRHELVGAAVTIATHTEFMKNGMNGGYISRPLEAPEWSDEARKRFEEDWAARSKKTDKRPVLEEGMEIVEPISPKQAQMLESREFTLAQVARIYGIPLGLVGLDSNGLEEEHKVLYQDILPPITGMIQGIMDLQLLKTDYGDTKRYFEFNLDAKLEGALDQKLGSLVSSAGAPVLTRNEARRKLNLPPVEGGDELITPLNVLVGDNPRPSPGVMPVPDPNSPAQDGSAREGSPNEAKAMEPQGKAIERRNALARRRTEYALELEDTLRKFFERQHKTVKSKQKAFDTQRWDKELADDLEKVSRQTVSREGELAAARLAMASFDMRQVENYLKKGAQAQASAINTVTQNQLDEGKDVDEVFEHAKANRATEAAFAKATALTSFAHHEAAKQDDPTGSVRQKTWITTTGAKSRHPHLNGQTVPLFGAFSNGAQYPGDPVLSADETANCKCLLEVI